MGIDSEYPVTVFKSNEEAIEWLKNTSKEGARRFIEQFLRYGETFPFPRLSVHNRYPGNVFAELCIRLDAETREMIQNILCDFLKQFDFDGNSKEYLFNLIIAVTTLETDPEMSTTVKGTSRSFEILMKMIEDERFYRTDNRAYGEDLHLFLLKALFSYPIEEKYNKQILMICKKYMKDENYAPICYRQIFDMSPEEGITHLSTYLKSTRNKRYHDYIFPIKMFFNRPETVRFIREKKLERVLKTIFDQNRKEDFERAGLVWMNVVEPTSILGTEEEIKIRIRASGEEISFDRRDLGTDVAEELLKSSQNWGFRYPRIEINEFTQFVDHGKLQNETGEFCFVDWKRMNPPSSIGGPSLMGGR